MDGEIKMIKAFIKKIDTYNNIIVDVMYLECTNKNMLEDMLYYTEQHLHLINTKLELEIISVEE